MQTINLYNFYAVNHKPTDDKFIERVEIDSLDELIEYHDRLCALWGSGVNIFEADTGEQIFQNQNFRKIR